MVKPILYSLGGAVGLILSVAAYEMFHILRVKRSNDLYRASLIEDDGDITLYANGRYFYADGSPIYN